MRTGYPLLDVFLSVLYFFLWFLWIMMLFWIIWDIFRSRDLSGWAKAGWLIFVIVLPLLGVLVYLVARGGKMHERQVRDVQAQDEAFRNYVRDTAGTNGQSQSAEITKLAGLRDSGVITNEEFEQAKAKVLA
jgi:hypothetical protein